MPWLAPVRFEIPAELDNYGRDENPPVLLWTGPRSLRAYWLFMSNRFSDYGTTDAHMCWQDFELNADDTAFEMVGDPEVVRLQEILPDNGINDGAMLLPRFSQNADGSLSLRFGVKTGG